jgi:hypothetical protein
MDSYEHKEKEKFCRKIEELIQGGGSNRRQRSSSTSTNARTNTGK